MDRNEYSEQQRQWQENINILTAAHRTECKSCQKPCATWESPLGNCRECREGIAATQRQVAQSLGGWLAFDEFRLERYDAAPENQKAYEVITGFNPEEDNFFLYGPCGTGKTHLAVGAVRRFWRSGIEITQPARVFRKVRGQSGEDEQREINRLAGLSCLVLDDLGSEKVTEFAIQILYDIIDRRIMNFRNGLVITSNLSFSQLAARLGDDRIPSRLAGACRVVEIAGQDQRGVRPRRKFDTSWKKTLSELDAALGCQECAVPDIWSRADTGNGFLSSRVPCPKCNPRFPEHPRHEEYIAALRIKEADFSSRDNLYPERQPRGAVVV